MLNRSEGIRNCSDTPVRPLRQVSGTYWVRIADKTNKSLPDRVVVTLGECVKDISGGALVAFVLVR